MGQFVLEVSYCMTMTAKLLYDNHIEFVRKNKFFTKLTCSPMLIANCIVVQFPGYTVTIISKSAITLLNTWIYQKIKSNQIFKLNVCIAIYLYLCVNKCLLIFSLIGSDPTTITNDTLMVHIQMHNCYYFSAYIHNYHMAQNIM